MQRLVKASAKLFLGRRRGLCPEPQYSMWSAFWQNSHMSCHRSTLYKGQCPGPFCQTGKQSFNPLKMAQLSMHTSRGPSSCIASNHVVCNTAHLLDLPVLVPKESTSFTGLDSDHFPLQSWFPAGPISVSGVSQRPLLPFCIWSRSPIL